MKTLLNYLQKNKGISRRDFLDMINEQAIQLNENTVENIKQEIKDGDVLTIYLPSGKTFKETIQTQQKFKPILVSFNKPKGYVVSKGDKHNKTIYDLLPKSWEKDFYYVGRLDKDSHGLLLLTNDPNLVNQLEHPGSRLLKIYEVEIDRLTKTKDEMKMRKGIEVDEQGNLKKLGDKGYFETLQFYDMNRIKDRRNGYYQRVLLSEGKKRHIRRVFKALGYKVLDLKRIKFGKYELGTIKPGKYRIHKI